ncbi:hypothetical protein CIL05_17090 [Virgibacillus profundi]|uniref:TRAP C4-dicarboxylate transport system permease DctM subunit domain-containing protein n=1 Tax=Virgibacillus profundi TaxID=2024555 RepID=A0A2A2IB54_9BACI|nr:TRAP transporter large permease [Virgibacillus profundi]PAV28350.1 hypothetical protein CIL05_17090 [Virgibacillus profundi]PXY52288.1 TRAP transporter large permease [Virgibacillus profundi]
MTFLIILIMLFVLILLKVPIAYSIGITCLIYIITNDMSLALIAQRTTMGVFSYPFLALPLFVFAGVLMEHGGITQRLMRLANALIGHIRGGLASTMVVSSAMFGALSGSALGVTAAIGSILLPEMKKKGNDPAFSAALQGTSGILGTLIPPSLTMVIIGATGNISIGALLIGGFIPGLILAAGLVIVSIIISKKNNYGKGERASLGEVGISLLHSIPPLLLPVIILGGIFSGIVTVTEAAVLGVVYAFVLSVFIYREVKLSKISTIAMQTITISAPILLIIGVSNLLGWILTAEQIPQAITEFFVSISPSAIIFLILINILLLILGTFMESNALILILIPILMPVIGYYDVNPVHFGVMFAVNLCIGSNTPPLGVTLITASKIAKVDLLHSSKAVIPFLAVMVFVLIITIFFPSLSTSLANLL